MTNNIHPNFVKASNLLFGSAGLGIVNLFVYKEVFTTDRSIMIGVLTLIVIGLIGYGIRLGKNWVRYLLLVVMVIGLIGLPYILYNLMHNTQGGIINIAQTFMQYYALWLVFRVPKPASAE